MQEGVANNCLRIDYNTLFWGLCVIIKHNLTSRYAGPKNDMACFQDMMDQSQTPVIENCHFPFTRLHLSIGISLVECWSSVIWNWSIMSFGLNTHKKVPIPKMVPFLELAFLKASSHNNTKGSSKGRSPKPALMHCLILDSNGCSFSLKSISHLSQLMATLVQMDCLPCFDKMHSQKKMLNLSRLSTYTEIFVFST